MQCTQKLPLAYFSLLLCAEILMENSVLSGLRVGVVSDMCHQALALALGTWRRTQTDH